MRPVNSRGFTLIEVLLAIFIFAVVISLIFTAYTGAIRIMHDTDSQSDISRMASIALDRMTEDLESASVSDWTKPGGVEGPVRSGRFLGLNEEIDGRGADRIRFLSKARVMFSNQPPGTGPAEISYYLTQDEEREDLILYRSETPVLEDSPEEGTGGLEVCRGLRSVEITYLGEGSETLEEWDSALPETRNRLPRSVAVTLFFQDLSVDGEDEEAVYPFRTRVVLPLARDQYGQLP